MEKAFVAFEKVRQSGVTNMFDRTTVCMLADITTEEYAYILKNYDKLKKEFELALDLEIQRTELTDKEKFMIAYDDVKDLEVRYGLDYDIFENGMSMLKTYSTSAKLILSKPLTYMDQFLEFCDDNEINEFYITNKVMDEDATHILTCISLNNNYYYSGTDFVRLEKFSEQLFAFTRKDVE